MTRSRFLGSSNLDAVTFSLFGGVQSGIDFTEKDLDRPQSPFLAEQKAKTHRDGNRSGGRLNRVSPDGFRNLFGAGKTIGRFTIVPYDEKRFAAVATDKIVGSN